VRIHQKRPCEEAAPARKDGKEGRGLGGIIRAAASKDPDPVADKRRPRSPREGKLSAARASIKDLASKDPGLALLQLGLVPIAVDTPRPVACRIVGVIDNAINHRA
jgi:hypothetical protein